MSRYRRFFPVSQDINHSPIMRELGRKFGLAGWRVWLEILSIADRNNNAVDCTSDAGISRLTSASETKNKVTRSVLDVLYKCGSIALDEQNKSITRVVNYWDFHRKRLPISGPPNLTKPNLTIIKNHKNDSSTAIEKKHSIAMAFPDDWKWLFDFIQSQSEVVPPNSFLDFRWWDSVSYACGGLDETFLTIEYNKIRRWLMENPHRRPTAKGWRRFVGNWLERAHDKERRFPNGAKTR